MGFSTAYLNSGISTFDHIPVCRYKLAYAYLNATVCQYFQLHIGSKK